MGSNYYFVIPGYDPESHSLANCKGVIHSFYEARAEAVCNTLNVGLRKIQCVIE